MADGLRQSRQDRRRGFAATPCSSLNLGLPHAIGLVRSLFVLSYTSPHHYIGGMDLAFLRFTPVPVRARRDGWPADLQRHFILNLARGMSAGEAAQSVGRSRQGVYALRDRPDGEGFARAWDDAVEFARQVSAAPVMRGMGSYGGLDTILVPRTYRGRLIGYVLREDASGLMQKLAHLDRMAEQIGSRPFGAPGFYELPGFAASGQAAEIDKIDETLRASPSPASISGGPFDSPSPNR